ncbi:unnamed protein product [Caenorhabditis nigoni]
MISRICLTLSICVVWLCSTAPNDTVLSPIIEKSASLARISAAISIHNGIYAEKSIVQEVTAEFLDISPSVAKELLKHDYHSLSDNMEKFHGSLNKIPAKLKNGDELITTINLLLDMKENQEYLKPGAIGDQTAHFAKTTKIMENSTIQSKELLKVFHLEDAVELLRQVRESDGQAMKTEEMEDILSDLAQKLFQLGSQLNMMMNYKIVFQDYLSLKSLTDDLQPINNAARIAGEYTETITKLDPFRNDLIVASKDTIKIKEATNEILKYSESIQHLFPTSIFLNSTAPKYDGKVITSGLLGYKDLNNIWTDLENPWFLENVLSNLDPTILKQGLESLKPFVSSLDSLIPFKRFDNEKEKKRTLDLAKKISEMHETGLKVKSVTNVKTPFEEVSKCIETLRPIQNPPDQEMLERIEVFSANVVENVKKFTKFMNDLNKEDLKKIVAVSEEIRKKIQSVTTAKKDTVKNDLLKKARKLELQHNLAEKLQEIADKLRKAPKHMFVEDRSIDYNVIRAVSTVFEGTNVESVLNCIKRSSVDNLAKMLRFLDVSSQLKNLKPEFQVATDFISNLAQGCEEVSKSVIEKAKKCDSVQGISDIDRLETVQGNRNAFKSDRRKCGSSASH